MKKLLDRIFGNVASTSVGVMAGVSQLYLGITSMDYTLIGTGVTTILLGLFARD